MPFPPGVFWELEDDSVQGEDEGQEVACAFVVGEGSAGELLKNENASAGLSTAAK